MLEFSSAGFAYCLPSGARLNMFKLEVYTGSFDLGSMLKLGGCDTMRCSVPDSPIFLLVPEGGCMTVIFPEQSL